MSYGYEPPKQESQGSWGEIFALTKAVFIALAVPLGIIALAVGLVIAAIMSLFTQPLFALLPLSILGVGIYYMVRRDKVAQAELDQEINGERPFRGTHNGPRAPR